MSFNHWPSVHWPSSGGGGGGTLSFPALVNETSGDAIRDRIVTLISALSPSFAPGNAFAAYRNEGDGNFVKWSEVNPAGAFRRFQVRDDGTDETPVVSNFDFDERKATMVMTIAYPVNARTGPQNALDRDDAMDSDFQQIELAVGVYGRQNFSTPYPDAVPLGISKRIERGKACDFLVLTETFTYRRQNF